ncbi:MAG TPA: HlyD family secretion protein [Bryobacteraceae bacterium]
MPNAVEESVSVETPRSSVSASRKRSPARIVVPVVLLILAAAGAFTYFAFRDQVSSDDAQVDGHISGIAPKISGNVIEVLVKDNQPVKAGQPLVRIDPRDYQAKVDVAKAALLQAESQFRSAQVAVPWTNETTQSGTSAANAQLADAQVEVERARLSAEKVFGADEAYAEANVRTRQANQERAQADLTRMKPLVEKQEISHQQYDAYVAAARMAESELAAAQEKLASARKDAAIREAALHAAESRVSHAQALVDASVANKRQVSIRSADAGSASAGVAAARANLAAAGLLLSYTEIAAPIDGVVTRKAVEVGNMVQPGQGLMTIIPLHDVWVTANFKETQLANVRPGQRAEIKVDMYGRKIGGRVDSIAGATGSRLSLLPPENATGNFVKVVQRIPVKILVNRDSSLILRPGMNVDVTIFTN